MPTLPIEARLQIAQAILASVHESKACQIIELPDGARLRVLGHFGHVAFELLDDSDLFDERLLLEVSMLCIQGPADEA